MRCGKRESVIGDPQPISHAPGTATMRERDVVNTPVPVVQKGRLAMFGMLLLAGAAMAHTSQPNKPIESVHRVGPNGLEGWVESHQLAGGQDYPTTLVIAQQGHVIRRISGDPFVWRWMFVENGKQVAYQTGSVHFNLWCVLVDLSSGRQLANHDCYGELNNAAPAWEKALQDSR